MSEKHHEFSSHKWLDPIDPKGSPNGNPFPREGALGVQFYLRELSEKCGIVHNVPLPVEGTAEEYLIMLDSAESLMANTDFWNRLPDTLHYTDEVRARIKVRSRAFLGEINELTKTGKAKGKEMFQSPAGVTEFISLRGTQATESLLAEYERHDEYFDNGESKAHIRSEIQKGLDQCRA